VKEKSVVGWKSSFRRNLPLKRKSERKWGGAGEEEGELV
jgi:hypothetical protein